MSVNDTATAARIRSGAKTYFFDVKKTKQGSPYLQITESRKNAGNQFERTTINVFPEAVDEFVEALDRLAKLI